MSASSSWRFYLAWLLPASVGMGILHSPWAALFMALGFHLALALVERLPFAQSSPPALAEDGGELQGHHRAVLWGHAVWQAWVMLVALEAVKDLSPFTSPLAKLAMVVALAIAVGMVSGSQGITYAHELGHSKRRSDRLLAWLLMGSVCYVHFMVEHYRGHHVRAATAADPATARRGESLWQFLPRTLEGSLVSAWRLEAARIMQLRSDWSHSPLLWATVAQFAWLGVLFLACGPWGVVLWLLQSAYAVYQLESINYIEHYGLVRSLRDKGMPARPEPFGVNHAWNADHWLTNVFIANLQRHSDHHMHAWKPYPSLAALDGPQLPTGYAGCLLLAAWPSRWFALMHPRLDALQQGAQKEPPASSAH